MRISDWSSDVCSSDLAAGGRDRRADAADARLHGGPGRIEAQTRRQLRGIGKLVDVGGGELIGIQRGDRARHVARFFLATLCGDDQDSEENTSELQSLMRISYAVFCLTKSTQ